VSPRIERLKYAIEKKENCRAKHVQSLPIREKMESEVIWDGVVETFDLENHPTAKRAYAWERGTGKEPEYKIVLGISPVNSANDAVKAAIMAKWKELDKI
jgi:hypothetical protein